MNCNWTWNSTYPQSHGSSANDTSHNKIFQVQWTWVNKLKQIKKHFDKNTQTKYDVDSAPKIQDIQNTTFSVHGFCFYIIHADFSTQRLYWLSYTFR